MSFPMHAFKFVRMSDAAPGSLLYCHGIWSFKLTPDDDGKEQMIFLTGDHAGCISPVPGRDGLTSAAPYELAIYVDSIDGSKVAQKLPAVSFGQKGAIIHGHQWDDHRSPVAVQMDGSHSDSDGQEYDFLPSFSLWLVDADKSRVGTNPIVSIG